MKSSFGNAVLMNLWEQVAALPPARRSLCLLAGLSKSTDSLGDLSVGERDRRLLLIRNELFGDRIEGVTECPNCGVRVELSFSIANVAGETTSLEPSPLHSDGYNVRWRLPTSQDLADLADETEPSRLRDKLLERCLLDVRHDRKQVPPLECPGNVIEKVSEAMALADPFADARLGMECPECGHSWKAAFDIGTYLWRELDVWAKRLLGEVHNLASAYGWCERDILALSAQRRRMYLEMVGA